MTEKNIVCLECGKPVANSNNVLARHLRSVHGTEWVDYVIKHEHAGRWPTCACGCDERLRWRKGGFGAYISGHDGKETRASVGATSTINVIPPGWVINPFTGQEERVSSDDDLALLQHCITKDDPVTLSHGISINWLDSTGRRRSLIPSCRHLERRLIFLFDDFRDVDGSRRLSAVRAWCRTNSYMLLSLRRQGEDLEVLGGFRGDDAPAGVVEDGP